MLTFSGKMSIFGGVKDAGMSLDSGLALYEPAEADLRPDLFHPLPVDLVVADPRSLVYPTWKRLKTESFYCAYRYDHTIARYILQSVPVKVVNVKTGKWIMVWSVDWGPNESTNRIIDLSPISARALDLDTDFEVRVDIQV